MRLGCLFSALLLLLTGCQKVQEQKLEDIPFAPDGISLRFESLDGKRNSFYPYDEVKCELVFKEDLFKSLLNQSIAGVSVSKHTRVNGKAIVQGELDKMLVNGFSSGKGTKRSEGIRFFHGFGKGGVIPREPGQYQLDMVIETPLGLWRLPAHELEIVIPEEHLDSFEEFKRLKVFEFLDHPTGLRKKGSPDPQIAYAKVVEFLEGYPDSVMVWIIAQRALGSWKLDCQKGFNTFSMEDKKEVAEILKMSGEAGTIKQGWASYRRVEGSRRKNMTPEELEYYESRLEIRKAWVDLVAE